MIKLVAVHLNPERRRRHFSRGRYEVAMKMLRLFALCILAAKLSNVESHGGLVIPYTWVDQMKQGDVNGMNTFGTNGLQCSGKWLGKGKGFKDCVLPSILDHQDKISKQF